MEPSFTGQEDKREPENFTGVDLDAQEELEKLRQRIVEGPPVRPVMNRHMRRRAQKLMRLKRNERISSTRA